MFITWDHLFPNLHRVFMPAPLVIRDSKEQSAPIYTSSAYDYEDLPETQYPRYFNTPNQRAVAYKIAVLENAEDGPHF